MIIAVAPVSPQQGLLAILTNSTGRLVKSSPLVVLVHPIRDCVFAPVAAGPGREFLPDVTSCDQLFLPNKATRWSCGNRRQTTGIKTAMTDNLQYWSSPPRASEPGLK